MFAVGGQSARDCAWRRRRPHPNLLPSREKGFVARDSGLVSNCWIGRSALDSRLRGNDGGVGAEAAKSVQSAALRTPSLARRNRGSELRQGVNPSVRVRAEGGDWARIAHDDSCPSRLGFRTWRCRSCGNRRRRWRGSARWAAERRARCRSNPSIPPRRPRLGRRRGACPPTAPRTRLPPARRRAGRKVRPPPSRKSSRLLPNRTNSLCRTR